MRKVNKDLLRLYIPAMELDSSWQKSSSTNLEKLRSLKLI